MNIPYPLSRFSLSARAFGFVGQEELDTIAGFNRLAADPLGDADIVNRIGPESVIALTLAIDFGD